MHFRQKKVFLDHVFFFFFNGKPGHRGPTHPILMENSINFFFFKPSLTNIRLIMDIILKSCFLCRIRTKSYLTTNEGSLHESYFTSTAPFMVVYMDLAWPHHFANYLHQQDIKGLTANKAHILIVVCSITR